MPPYQGKINSRALEVKSLTLAISLFHGPYLRLIPSPALFESVRSFKTSKKGPYQESSCSFSPFCGVLEDMKVPNKAGDGVRGLGEPQGSFTKNFIKIGQQDPC